MKDRIITVIGSLNYDIIVKQKRMPLKGETYTGDSISFSGGGKGANQAVQAAKLGAETYLVGRVGADGFGDYLIEELKRYQVRLDYLERSTATTGMGIVHALEDGSVFATITTGANGEVDQAQIDRVEPLIARSAILVLQMEIPIPTLEYIISLGRHHNCQIILNAAPAVPISDQALRQVDYLIVNEPEASFYCQAEISDFETANRHYHKLYTHFDGILIITLGAKGSFLYDKQVVYHIPPNEVPVIETTGAGDSYIGAFATALLNGKSVYDAACFGAAAAEITVTRIGAQSAMPDLQEMSAQ